MVVRAALWRAVKKARPTLTDQELDDLLKETALRERRLVLDGMNFDQAREIVREDLFPPDLDPWAGDDEYGPMP